MEAVALDQIQLKKPEVIRGSADTARSFRDPAFDTGKAGCFRWKKKRRGASRYDTGEKFVSDWLI